MELWLDSTDIQIIKHAHDLGILEGVTTNPTLLATAGAPPEKTLDKLLSAQDGPVAVQPMGDSVEELLEQAHKWYQFSSRFIIKVPVSHEGWSVMQQLHDDGIPVMATAIFEPYQAYLALKLGAKYVAPYLGRILEHGEDPAEHIKAVQHIKKTYGFEGELLAAGVKTLDLFQMCTNLGTDAATLPKQIYEELMCTHAATERALEIFKSDWEKISAHAVH